MIRVIRRRLTDVPFAVIVALVGVNNAVTFFLRPTAQPAHRLLSPLDYIWCGMYAAGGLLMLAGILTARANWEAAGCFAFAGGAAISAVATAVVFGRSAWNTSLILTLFAGAALTRAWHLARGRVLVLLDVQASADLAKRGRP